MIKYTAGTEKFAGFQHGMGIGGWLTNYKRFNVLPMNKRLPLTIGDCEHFQKYITEKDIENIASFGMDHIRLGFDQIVIEEYNRPGAWIEENFRHIENFVKWCGKYRVNAVLNLHKAIGNYCDISEKVPLIGTPELETRFVNLWCEMEKRFSAYPDAVFELMNEVRDVEPDAWNDLAEKTIKAIRKRNPKRRIIIGGTCANSPDKLNVLRIFDDENVIYTFHNYHPFEFTHQRGVLQASCMYYNRDMYWPSDTKPYYEFREALGWGSEDLKKVDRMDRNFLRITLQGAFDFVEKHPDKILWCGEFGTIRHADRTSRENFMEDTIALLKEHNIPYCVWNYLSTPNDGNRFSLVDDDCRKILSERMLRIIQGNIR